MALIQRNNDNDSDLIVNTIHFDNWELEENNATNAFEINNNGTNAISISNSTRITTFDTGTINSDSTAFFLGVGLVQQVRIDTSAVFLNRGIISLGNALSDPIIDTTGTDIRLSPNTSNVGAITIDNQGDLIRNDSGSAGLIQFTNTSTGTGGANGTVLGLTSSTFFINNQEATNINISAGNDITLMPDGNVGIGTNTPNYQLEINGGAIGTLFSIYGPSMARELQIINSTKSNAGDTYTFSAISGSGNIAFATNSGTERMRIDEDGNVGIGTDSPSRFFQTLENSGSSISIGSLRVLWGTEADDDAYMDMGAYSSINNIDTKGRDFRIFSTSIDPIMYMEEDTGNVGIGTDSPSFTLDVGSGTVGMIRINSGDGDKLLLTNNGTNGSKIGHNSGWAIEYKAGPGNTTGPDGQHSFFMTESSAYVEKVRISENGLAIGAFNSSISLAIGDSDTGIDWVSDGVLEMYSNNQSRLHLNAGAGNMGFGDNTNPQVEWEFEDASYPRMRLTDGRANYGSSSGVLMGSFEFYSRDSSFSGNYGAVTSIDCVSANTTVAPDGDLQINNYTDDAISGSLDVKRNGDCENTTGNYNMISDAKFKENIVDANNQWEDIKSLRFRNYTLIKDREEDNIITFLGLVAQEVEQTSSGLIGETQTIRKTGQTQKVMKTKKEKRKREDENGNMVEEEVDITREVVENITEQQEYKTLKLTALYMKGMKALQEALLRIETLEAEVELLKNQ